MIDFCFDNNVLQEMLKSDDFPELLQKLIPLRKSAKCRFYISAINFEEQLHGCSEASLHHVQTFFRNSRHLSGASILLLPSQNIRSCKTSDVWFNPLSDSDATKQANALIGFVNDVITARSFCDIEDKVKKIKKSIAEDKQRWQFGMNEHVQLDERELITQQLRDGGIVKANLQIKMSELCRVAPSLFYWTRAVIDYRNHVDNGRLIKPGDSNDLEQLIYLDRCDYLVTNDRFLREHLINDSSLAELKGRALSLKEFRQWIDRKVVGLAKRAPMSVIETLRFGNDNPNGSTGKNT